MREGTLPFGKAHLSMIEWAGGGVPLVLLHGAGGNALVWEPMMRHLSGRHAVALDLPGHGRSPDRDDWTLRALAEDLHEAMTAHLPQPILLGGHSWGGKLAALVAAHHPESVRGLFLVDPSPSHALRVRLDGMVERMFGPELGAWPDLEEAWQAVQGLPQYAGGSPSLLRRNLEVDPSGCRARVRSGDLQQIIRTCLLEDVSDSLQRLDRPVLLVVASQSAHWQKTTNETVLAHAVRVELPGDHWLPLHQAEALAEHFSRWERSLVSGREVP